MRISGLQKLSLLDFPGRTAATVFTGGCNFRCPFCHNAPLVTGGSSCRDISQEEFFTFLENRRGKLDGVCVTGGEPLLQQGIEDFLRRIKAAGFQVKLDTNGSLPEKLRSIIDEGLADYIAMDVKNAPSKYALTAGIPGFDLAPVAESAALLKEGRIPYEFRTTLVKGLHSPEDVPELGRFVEGAEKYFLQNFADSGDLVGFPTSSASTEMEPFSPEELAFFEKALSPYVAELRIRG